MVDLGKLVSEGIDKVNELIIYYRHIVQRPVDDHLKKTNNFSKTLKTIIHGLSPKSIMVRSAECRRKARGVRREKPSLCWATDHDVK